MAQIWRAILFANAIPTSIFGRGGPMNYADQVGLFNVVQAMGRFAQNPLDDAAFWKPAPLLAKLAVEGKSFN